MKSETVFLIPFLVVILLALGAPRTLQVADSSALDAGLRLRHGTMGPRSIDPRLALVIADDQTYRVLKTSELGAGRLAAVLNALADAGVRLVVVDVLLTEGTLPDLHALTAALRRVPVVLPRLNTAQGPGFRYPTPVLLAAAAEGSISSARNMDGIQRRSPSTDASQFPSLATQAARLLGVQQAPDGVLLDYPGPSGTTIPRFRFEELLGPDPIPTRLRLALHGAIVVVGDAGSRSRDLVRTPFEGSTPAAVLPLLELDSLLSDSPLTEAPPWSSALAALLMAILLGVSWYTRPGRAGVLPALALGTGVLVLAAAAFLALGLYGWTIPLISALVVSVSARAMALAVGRAVEYRILEAQSKEQERWATLGQKSTAVLHAIHGLSAMGVQLATKTTSQGTPLDDWNQKAFDSIRTQAQAALGEMRQPEETGGPMQTLSQLVEQSVSSFRFRKPGVPLKISLAENSPIPGVSPSLLVLTLGNLLDNAAEAQAESGSNLPLEVRTEISGSHAVVVVSDSGPGIPFCRGCLKPRCLPCPRLRLGVTTKPGGNGFGLSQARELVRRQRGTFLIKTGPGGTTISLGLTRVG